MYFDLYTVIAMMLIVLIALVGMSRSFIIVAHERILSALLNEPYDDMKHCTNKPILFRSAWGVIRNALANEDHDNYNSVDDVLAKVRKEITLDIQEANKDPIAKHITPLLREALDQLDLYRDHVRVKLLYNPMLSDTYSRQRVYRTLNI